ncbi:DUF1704 domain-containing protein [Candidatus Gracilibacteria bacterium]|nr:DUF1704 domain-containing protein [Candidatus Gracilibacteria bacterium]
MPKSHGVLGQNARNLLYIQSEDFSHYRRLADSKLKTKKFLSGHGVAVPQTFAILKNTGEISMELIESLEPPFVIKPNNGYGGKGILIIGDKRPDKSFITSSGEIYTSKQIYQHCIRIIDGFFSLSGRRDSIFIEKKIELVSDIELLGKYGLPDIRIIIYNSVPVMAMMRIPTAESKGKANIHAGACAIGIDLGNGRLTYISHHGKQIKSIPGIGDMRGLLLPDWDKILSLAVRVQYVTKIPFLGCDIVLDDKDGPLLLEMNVRPGLEIQNVNLAPLEARLKRVDGIIVDSIEKGVRLGKDLFGGIISERVESVSGKKLLGLREYLQFSYKEKNYNYIADIRASQSENYIDKEFARDVLGIDIESQFQVRLETTLMDIKRVLIFTCKELSGEKLLLGKKALRGFFIDPYKYKKGENPYLANLKIKEVNSLITESQFKILQDIDIQLRDIDKKIPLLKLFYPINVGEEKQKFIASKGEYAPQFIYNPLSVDIQELKHNLRRIDIPDIPLSELFFRKQQEIMKKLDIVEAHASKDMKRFSQLGESIFGIVEDENFEITKTILAQKGDIEAEIPLSEDEIRSEIKKFNHIYGIKLKLKIGDSAARFSVKGDFLSMRRSANVGKKEFRSIIAHEIEGHYLRTLNARKLPYFLFQKGTAGYLATEEGIAIYNQNRFLSPKLQKFYGIYERYFFLRYAQKHSFSKLVSNMCEYYNNDYARVFDYILRLKRGVHNTSKEGIFMKDVVYLNGYTQVKNYIDGGGLLEELYIGKVGIDDIKDISQLDFYHKEKSKIVTPFFLS